MAIAQGYVANFETLRRAVRNGDAALVECTDAATGKPVIALCAMQREGNGDTTIVPLARLFDGDPYQELNPPH